MKSEVLALSQQIEFRPFKDGDFSAIQDLHSKSFGVLSRGHYSSEQMAANEREFRSQGYLGELRKCNLVLAEIKGEITASAGWCLPEPHLARIRKVFVSPSYAGLGVGRMIMKIIEREILQTGIRDLFLCASMNAIPFYEKIGFSKTHIEQRRCSGVVEPIMVMWKTL